MVELDKTALTCSRIFSAQPLGTYVVFACCFRCSINFCISSCTAENRGRSPPQGGKPRRLGDNEGTKIRWVRDLHTQHGLVFLSAASPLEFIPVSKTTLMVFPSALCMAERGDGERISHRRGGKTWRASTLMDPSRHVRKGDVFVLDCSDTVKQAFSCNCETQPIWYKPFSGDFALSHKPTRYYSSIGWSPRVLIPSSHSFQVWHRAL